MEEWQRRRHRKIVKKKKYYEEKRKSIDEKDIQKRRSAITKKSYNITNILKKEIKELCKFTNVERKSIKASQ